jgi:hypothetical protein
VTGFRGYEKLILISPVSGLEIYDLREFMKIQLLTNNILEFHVRYCHGHALELDYGI